MNTMLERPEKGSIFAAVFYNMIAFYSLPFLLLLLMQGSFSKAKITAWMEVIFHTINFAVALIIFWRYLEESFQDFTYDIPRILKTAGLYALIAVAVAAVLFYAGTYVLCYVTDWYPTIAVSALPVTEVDLFLSPLGLADTVPVLSGICLVVLCPLSVSCLFYATVFSPVAYNKPWLAYLLIIPYLAFPALCNALTFWDPMEQFLVFLVRLPCHLLACRAYQKADSVWAPIFMLMICNLVGFLFLLLQQLYYVPI